MTVGEKIKALREQYQRPDREEGLSQSELAEMVGVTRNIVGGWERGTFPPPLARRKKLAEIFDKPIEYFADDEDILVVESKEQATGIKELLYASAEFVAKMTAIPIMGAVPAGTPNEAIEDYQGVYPVPREFLGSEPTRCFVVRAHGESMTGLGICNGDMLAFRQQDNADDGDVVIAEVEGDGVTCKRLRKKKGEAYLESANASHREIRRPFKVIGKVIWRGGRPWR